MQGKQQQTGGYIMCILFSRITLVGEVLDVQVTVHRDKF